MALFTIKYAPKNADQVFGQQLAVSQLRNFITQYRQQQHKAALLLGPIGCGKTSSVYAIAKELKYDVVELNSSDLRNAENITQAKNVHKFPRQISSALEVLKNPDKNFLKL